MAKVEIGDYIKFREPKSKIIKNESIFVVVFVDVIKIEPVIRMSVSQIYPYRWKDSYSIETLDHNIINLGNPKDSWMLYSLYGQS